MIKLTRLSKGRSFIADFRDNAFKFGGITYRGKVILYHYKGKILVVNYLPVEEYLYGVVPAEMSAGWPIEALKAQAICARTYAYRRIIQSKSPYFDVDNGTASQVYRGKSLETPSVRDAVNSTSNLVMTNNGKLINAFFYSSCGGITEQAKYVWTHGDPSTRIRRCRYCRHAKTYAWKTFASKTRLDRFTKRIGIGRFKYLKSIKKSPSGRIIKVAIYGSKKKMIMQGNAFRLAMGADILRSLRYRSKKSSKGIYFVGRGWGHGVGMCQYGAKTMSEKYRYKRILNFYFKKISITKYDSSRKKNYLVKL
jgi:stage II sporulation protein D